MKKFMKFVSAVITVYVVYGMIYPSEGATYLSKKDRVEVKYDLTDCTAKVKIIDLNSEQVMFHDTVIGRNCTEFSFQDADMTDVVHSYGFIRGWSINVDGKYQYALNLSNALIIPVEKFFGINFVYLPEYVMSSISLWHRGYIYKNVSEGDLKAYALNRYKREKINHQKVEDKFFK